MSTTDPTTGRDLEPREVYEKLCRIVEYNTGPPGPQLPAIPVHTVRVHAEHANISQDEVSKALRAHRENDLDGFIRYEDPEGIDRLVLTDPEMVWAAARYEADRDDPDREVVTTLYRIYVRLDGGRSHD